MGSEDKASVVAVTPGTDRSAVTAAPVRALPEARHCIRRITTAWSGVGHGGFATRVQWQWQQATLGLGLS